jgi:hypothetical protein
MDENELVEKTYEMMEKNGSVKLGVEGTSDNIANLRKYLVEKMGFTKKSDDFFIKYSPIDQSVLVTITIGKGE